MTQRTVGLTLASGFLLAMLLATDARAQLFEPTGKDTLRALPGVELLVEPLEPGLAPSGITADAIAADVSAQLRAAGITIYPSQMQNPSAAKAYLYVQVSGFQAPPQGYVIAAQAHVRQSVRSLVTESTIVNAMTWDRSIVFLAGAQSPAAAVKREIQDLLEQFVRDWKATR
jgi:hypothetical protein